MPKTIITLCLPPKSDFTCALVAEASMIEPLALAQNHSVGSPVLKAAEGYSSRNSPGSPAGKKENKLKR